MAPGASRKRRRVESIAEVAEPEIPSIVFASPGLKPDVRLKIFVEAEIHYYSLILKLHSNFFRKFLDSPDKSPAPASASFKYEYATVVDEDGTWALEPAAKASILLTKPDTH
jgi:hypothetical protein